MNQFCCSRLLSFSTSCTKYTNDVGFVKVWLGAYLLMYSSVSLLSRTVLRMAIQLRTAARSNKRGDGVRLFLLP